MAENVTVARPYAEAIFALADAGGELGKWSQTLAVMASVAANAEVRAATGNPNLTTEQVYGLFAAACGDLVIEAQNFLRVLIENDRLAALPEIRDNYEALKNEREGVVDALITTALPLDDAQLAALVAQLESRFKRKIKPQVAVDANLIGGVHMQVGDEVIDGSVRGKLVAMAAALMK
ncbi:MAG: ATP synthase F1 subunit delta [Betaproteobacteria bacterium RIFCSPLOWO2_02_FULL_67_26]|nr:MAG: ATP synthase F1 subunit delta [Betaproteobacteria bacterium RIFCSPLOWO2_02_FULL_67_26]